VFKVGMQHYRLKLTKARPHWELSERHLLRRVAVDPEMPVTFRLRHKQLISLINRAINRNSEDKMLSTSSFLLTN
jgi:hypothetical protein